jgi:hypothetical protein
MKNRLLFLVSLFALSLCTWEVHALNTVSLSTPSQKSDIEEPPPGYEKINLLGDLLYNIGPNAIVAGASDDAVYIAFNQSFGNVNISIYNGMGGIVYNTVVNTDVQQVVIIPFTSAANGSYTVELNNANGYADGDFQKNK